MSFDIFLNGERLCVKDYNKSYNRITIEDNELREYTKYLIESDFKHIHLWDSRKIDFKDFIKLLNYEL